MTVSTDIVRLPKSDWCSLSPLLSDWAYLENWCRGLTRSHADVFVFTVPLYLPKRDPDGKWRVVSSTTKRVLSHLYRETVWY